MKYKKKLSKPLNIIPATDKVICFFDGACAPCNPKGYMGWGAVIQFEKECKYIFDGADKSDFNSNNVAEYLALLEILKHLAGEKGKRIEIFGDSDLVVSQMSGRYRIKQGLYVPYAVDAKRKFTELCQNNSVMISWIPRELNDDADQLSNEGIKKVAGDYVSFKKGY